MTALPLFLLILLSAWGWGRLLLRRFPHAGPWESAGLGLPLGLGIVGQGLYFLGLAGMLKGWILGLWVGLPALLLSPLWLKEAAALGKYAVGVRPGAFSLSEKIFLSVASLCAAVYFVAAGAPPVTPDVVSYHLALPKIYLRQGGIEFLPHINASAWPALFNMLYLPGLAFGKPQTAQYLHWFAGVLLLLWTCRFGARVDRWTGLAAAALLAATPVFKILAVGALIDLAVALYAVTSLHALWRFQKTGRRGWLVLCGSLAGFMGAVKLTGVLWFGILGLIWLAGRWRRKPGEGSPAAEAALLAGPFLLIVAPWLIRSQVVAGNPVWPFFHGLFGGRYWDEAQTRLWTRFAYGESLGGDTWLASLWLKVKGLFWPTGGAAVFRGPFAAAFVLLFALRRGRLWGEKTAAFLAPVALFMAAYLAVMPESFRYLTPVLPLMAVGVAGGLNFYFHRPRARWLAAGALVLLVAARFPGREDRLGDKARAAIGLMPADVYLERSLDVYPISRWINENLGPHDRVLFLNSRKGLYMDRDYLWGSPVDQKFISYDGLKDAADLRARWKAKGVTHVLVFGPSVDWPVEGGPAVASLLSGAPRAAQKGPYILFALP